jgi:5-carboxymethyl-2-hydroxymuconate isomerase
MPHLTIQYSANLLGRTDMQALCELLSRALASTGLFPLGGIRVRAFSSPDYVVADGLPENAFADLVLRIGAGRSQEEKQATGKTLMAAAEKHFAPLLASPHFALSLEIAEISSALSWKSNSIHHRLAAQART